MRALAGQSAMAGESMTDSMIAIEIAGFGGPEVLKPVERPIPRPGKGELLIEVAAAGVNRPDVLQRQGAYRPPPGASDIPGLEVAGRVVALGEAVSGWRVGDPVTALVAGGGYAEFCAAPVPQCLPIPKGLDAIQAGALPETFFTVWTNLFERGHLKAGETVLIHGGSSGIGTTAIQLAKAFGAQAIFATAGSREKCQACERLGATRGIDYKHEDFVKVVKDATAGRGVDVILDMVGGDYIQRNITLLAVEGRIVYIAFLRGPKADVNFLPLMLKRGVLTGSTLRARSVEQKGAIAASLARQVWPLLDHGKVKPEIYRTFPLVQAADAHRLMETSEHIGKIVLTL
jgi:putative PIG3 family NAD(P)H quinone oxidoreductase